jgi:hypothetical protein
MAQGDWTAAGTILATLVTASPDNVIAINNLCICMLYQGKLQEVGGSNVISYDRWHDDSVS